MPVIELTTSINAPQQRCFDMARSINVHLQSMRHTQEKAIAGVQSGFIKQGETVTWLAKHLGIYFTMKLGITHMNIPGSFTDEMLEGPFAAMRHDHLFYQQGNQCVMQCRFFYRSPWGILGWLADALFLKKYMRNLLLRRNSLIKTLAEQG